MNSWAIGQGYRLPDTAQSDVAQSGEIVIVLALTAIQPIVNFVRPEWTRLRSVARILSDAALLGLAALSLNTGRWVVLTDPSAATPQHEVPVNEINRWIGISLAVAMGILAVMLLSSCDGWSAGGGDEGRCRRSSRASWQ